jgi:hypothetical protein
MADFRKLARALILAEDRVTDRAFEVIRREFIRDGVIDREELEFLLDVRKAVGAVPHEFNRLLFQVLTKYLLKDGLLGTAEAEWLRRLVFTDDRADADEKQFLRDLRAGAKSTSPDFDALCDSVLAEPS